MNFCWLFSNISNAKIVIHLKPLNLLSGNQISAKAKDTYEGSLLGAKKGSNSEFDLAKIIVNGDCLR